MGKNRFTEQAFIFSLNSFKYERRQLISDSLGQSADLYEALYENKNAPLREVKCDRYGLLALKRHFEDAMTQIAKLPESEYFASMKLFVKSYRRYIASIKGTVLDMNFLDANLDCLEKILAKNKSWEENVKKCRIDFLKMEKEFDNEIDKMRKAGF